MYQIQCDVNVWKCMSSAVTKVTIFPKYKVWMQLFLKIFLRALFTLMHVYELGTSFQIRCKVDVRNVRVYGRLRTCGQMFVC